MLSKTGFNGILSNYSIKSGKGEEEPSWVKLTIKHTAEGEVQNFIDSLEKAYNTNNLKDLFATTVQWDKMAFAHLNFEVDVKFDEVSFKAVITGITVSRKTTHSVDSFTYNIVLEKDLASDNLDSLLITQYLKRKHVNAEDKKVFTLFNVKMERSVETTDEDILE